VLRDGGDSALTIDRLCKDLGRTKGAFYHHFADVGVYTAALLAAWETMTMAAASGGARTASARRAANGAPADRTVESSGTTSSDVALDRSIRAWSLRDARAHQVVSRVDERRMARLTARYPAEISLSLRRKLARLEYAAQIGLEHLYPEMPSAVSRELEQLLKPALLHAAKRSAQVRDGASSLRRPRR
jgi:AcrR family transcriptional regulator